MSISDLATLPFEHEFANKNRKKRRQFLRKTERSTYCLNQDYFLSIKLIINIELFSIFSWLSSSRSFVLFLLLLILLLLLIAFLVFIRPVTHRKQSSFCRSRAFCCDVPPKQNRGRQTNKQTNQQTKRRSALNFDALSLSLSSAHTNIPVFFSFILLLLFFVTLQQ